MRKNKIQPKHLLAFKTSRARKPQSGFWLITWPFSGRFLAVFLLLVRRSGKTYVGLKVSTIWMRRCASRCTLTDFVKPWPLCWADWLIILIKLALPNAQNHSRKKISRQVNRQTLAPLSISPDTEQLFQNRSFFNRTIIGLFKTCLMASVELSGSRFKGD